MPNIKIAITGATGLVGSNLAPYLAKRGYRVRALVRCARSAEAFVESWASLGIEVQEANILQPADLTQAFTNIDVVVHTAAIVDPYASPQSIYAANVLGSKSVLDAAEDTGVKQLVFISSLSVITGNQDQYNSSEKAPLLMCGEPYADSKVQAEKLLTNKMNSTTAITILRPGFIYGPRERAWLPQLINAIASRRAILVDGGAKETNVIYIDNLNRAIEAALLNEKAYGQIYNLTDGQSITKKQLFDAISKELRLPPIKKNLPSWLVKPVFWTVSSIVPLLPVSTRKQLSRFSRAAYRLIGINQGFSIAKAEQDLNYTNRIPFAEGMALTMHYFKENTNILSAADQTPDRAIYQSIDKAADRAAAQTADH